LAAEWFVKAAKQGHAPSQFQLGSFYENGMGVDPDMKTAVEYYRTASEQGYPQAQFRLATCYNSGNGVEEDPELALALYMAAADQGLTEAAYSLAFCCYAGFGTEPDMGRAAMWVSKAQDEANKPMTSNFVQLAENCLGDAEAGDVESHFFLSFLYAFGLGVNQDQKRTKYSTWRMMFRLLFAVNALTFSFDFIN
jgi:TPR repeat protein